MRIIGHKVRSPKSLNKGHDRMRYYAAAWHGARAAGAALALFAGFDAAPAQLPVEFFKGKTISLLIGFGPGGEDDLWARIMSRHMSSHIPGNPTVLPQHMPGSGGLLVANRLYNVAAKDGSVIGMINRGIPFEPLLGGQGTQFDPLRIGYIGSPSRDTTVCAARKDAAVKTLADLSSKELSVGGTGSGADTAIYPEFLSAVIGLKFKLVKGYRGSHEIQLAMERNEVQGICLAYDSLSRGNLARSGQINVLLQAALHPDPRLKEVPSVLDSVRAEGDRKALALFFARAAMGRPFVAPPDIPAERLAALREAFAATLRDPAFLDDARRQNLNVVPVSGAELAEIVANAYRTPSDTVKHTLQALGRGG
jgi:tripartite-type tricarboxylate transporter receptor subunit TctC